MEVVLYDLKNKKNGKICQKRQKIMGFQFKIVKNIVQEEGGVLYFLHR